MFLTNFRQDQNALSYLEQFAVHVASIATVVHAHVCVNRDFSSHVASHCICRNAFEPSADACSGGGTTGDVVEKRLEWTRKWVGSTAACRDYFKA